MKTKCKIYRVVATPLSRGIDDIAEDIADLAHAIRPKDKAGLAQTADAIMHLAADLKMDAERSIASLTTAKL